MAPNSDARALYLQLLAAAESPSDKLEMASAIVRAAYSRLKRGRGALHVRRPIVVRLDGLRYSVPAYDNSFASGEPGEAYSPVVPELVRLLEQRPQPVCVVAIEPIPWLAKALVHTAALNGFSHVTVVPRAIAGEAELELAVPAVGFDALLAELAIAPTELACRAEVEGVLGAFGYHDFRAIDSTNFVATV